MFNDTHEGVAAAAILAQRRVGMRSMKMRPVRYNCSQGVESVMYLIDGELALKNIVETE